MPWGLGIRGMGKDRNSKNSHPLTRGREQVPILANLIMASVPGGGRDCHEVIRVEKPCPDVL